MLTLLVVVVVLLLQAACSCRCQACARLLLLLLLLVIVMGGCAQRPSLCRTSRSRQVIEIHVPHVQLHAGHAVQAAQRGQQAQREAAAAQGQQRRGGRGGRQRQGGAVGCHVALVGMHCSHRREGGTRAEGVKSCSWLAVWQAGNNRRKAARQRQKRR